MKLYYLEHSGFMLDAGDTCYIFDYWKDEAQVVKKAQAAGKVLWFFVTHWHGDHYSPAILDFNSPTTRYIVHTDVPHKDMPKERTTVMAVGDTPYVEDLKVTMYGSTDEGGSFLIDTGDATIFHAGDLNWWHWLGDTPENIDFARDFAAKEFKRIAGITPDLAMFPVDDRLEAAREWGAFEFLHAVGRLPKLFVPMHRHGPVWEPSLYFKSLYEHLPVWSPKHTGDSVELEEYGIE